MPCVDDPCSQSPAIVAARKEVASAQAEVQKEVDFSRRQAAAGAVKVAQAKLAAVTNQCNEAHGGATAPVVSGAHGGGTGILNLAMGAAFNTTSPCPFSPILTFAPPFFTSVTLGTFAGAQTFSPIKLGNLEAVSVTVKDVTGSGVFSRCSGHMTLTVSFTTVSKGSGLSVPTSKEQDTCTAALSTSFALSAALLQHLTDEEQLDVVNADFAKESGPPHLVVGGLTGPAKFEGGILAENFPSGVLLNVTMRMLGAVPLV